MQTLTPRALSEEWAKKKTRPVYYLFGEETAMKEAALKKLEDLFQPESFNFSVRDAEVADIEQALDEACTAPMLAETRFVVLKHVEKLKKEPMKKLLAYLADPCPSACLLLLADWPREKADPLPAVLGKDCAAVDFSPMTPPQAVERVNSILLTRGVKADGEALELLVELLGTDSVTLDGETEKIALYMHGQNRFFSPEDALALAGFSRVQNPFELANAVCGRRPREAAEAAAKMLASGAEPLALLAQFSRALERMLKVKRLSGEGPSAAYQAGMSPGQYHAALRDSASYTDDKLLRSLRRCLEVEELLKSSSKRDPSLLLRQLVHEITAGK
ncbi:MAG TPA: DNA polymerase III subunit delta [Elusimicrobia bacterium]|nr:MAG: DNA polymerase III subunit delta [Elusimicrobia bacterium GWD2_63_28]HCC47106.1 DNA polymerase III subunit delta [Elusimicrobiota bacterium]